MYNQIHCPTLQPKSKLLPLLFFFSSTALPQLLLRKFGNANSLFCLLLLYVLLSCGLQAGRSPAVYTPSSIAEKLHLPLNCRDLFTTIKGNLRRNYSNFELGSQLAASIVRVTGFFFFFLLLWTNGSPASSASGYWAGQWQSLSWWLSSSQWTFTTR